MNTTDTRSVHELALALVGVGVAIGVGMDISTISDKSILDLELAFRKKVVDEAVLGQLEIIHDPMVSIARATSRLKVAFDYAANVLISGDTSCDGKWHEKNPHNLTSIDASLVEIFPEGTYGLVLLNPTRVITEQEVVDAMIAARDKYIAEEPDHEP
jgi:hypothetical protein